MALDSSLFLIPKQLRTLAVTLELLVVSLQSFDDTAVLLRTHLRQLQDNGEGSGQAKDAGGELTPADSVSDKMRN